MFVHGFPECGWLSWLIAYQACWQHLFLILQFVSDCHVSPCFKSVDDTCSWLFSQWVAVVPHCIVHLPMMPVHFLDGEWLMYLSVFQSCWWFLLSTLQWVSGCYFILYFKPMMPIFGSLAGEWLLPCFKSADNHYLALQVVSCCCASLCFKHTECWLYLFLPLQDVSGYMPCCILSPLMMPVLNSPAGEWLSYLSVFHTCWQCPFWTVQCVSGCHELFVWSLLTMPVLDCPVCEWLCTRLLFMSAKKLILGSLVCEQFSFFTMLEACWQGLFLFLQLVRTPVPHCISLCLWNLSLTLQRVSGSLCSSLLITLDHGSSVCE